MSITLTEKQAAGIKAIKMWLTDLETNCPRKEDFEGRERFDFSDGKHQQVMRIFGFAGTGKSTLVDHALKELDLRWPDVLTATFTGKAAYVLRRKGIPEAQTIHSLIYSVSEASEAEIDAKKEEIEALRLEALSRAAGARLRIALPGQDRRGNDNARRDAIGRALVCSPNSPVPDCRLVVLDEVSMVGPEMAADLLSFGKPILVLGDPGQLPPIKGEGAFTQQEPDVMLTEIHRQAAESPIIHLATLARNGEHIPYGDYGDCVSKMRRNQVDPALLLRGDQVIVGKNATRLALNNAMRAKLHHTYTIPVIDDKIICLKNDNEHGLINGMFLQLADIEPTERPELYFLATVKDDEGTPIGGLDRKGAQRKMQIYAGHFLDHAALDPDRFQRDHRDMKKFVQATFGYACTVHKFQGSSAPNIIFWDVGLGRTREDRARLLYTAITRAESGLLLLD